jgi:hypothetical protein
MEKRSAEDELVRQLVIGAAVSTVLGLLVLGTILTVLVSSNFNVLQWME